MIEVLRTPPEMFWIPGHTLHPGEYGTEEGEGWSIFLSKDTVHVGYSRLSRVSEQNRHWIWIEGEREATSVYQENFGNLEFAGTALRTLTLGDTIMLERMWPVFVKLKRDVDKNSRHMEGRKYAERVVVP